LPAEGSFIGVEFEIDWENIWLGNRRLPSNRIGYRVKHKSRILGGKETSFIWKYGAELVYQDDDGKQVKIFLCKVCHLQKLRTAAKKCSAYHHIAEHLKTVHRVSARGLIPDLPHMQSDPFELAASITGSQRAFSHKPYNEDELQGALVDWVILKDISFLCATSSATRGLLTWNRAELLQALPSAPGTISQYVGKLLDVRKAEIKTILNTCRSKVAISVDVWSSPNHLSFMAIIGHLIGEKSSGHIVI
jgi:hypothetical protein